MYPPTRILSGFPCSIFLCFFLSYLSIRVLVFVVTSVGFGPCIPSPTASGACIATVLLSSRPGLLVGRPGRVGPAPHKHSSIILHIGYRPASPTSLGLSVPQRCSLREGFIPSRTPKKIGERLIDEMIGMSCTVSRSAQFCARPCSRPKQRLARQARPLAVASAQPAQC